ncbi:MAG: YceI family protein [Flavobacteriales bacterium AspAUS03]
MTIKAHTQPLSFKVKSSMKNDQLSFKSENFSIYRHDFKINYKEKQQPNTMVENEIDLQIPVISKR